MTTKRTIIDKLLAKVQKIYDDYLEAQRYIPSERLEALISEQHAEWNEAEIDPMAEKELQQFLSCYYTYMSLPSL
ncbi:MAG: hypothetical protein KTR30_18565 [Saprospiraceae bacterium]|nr:hypothetical protein [Saprospiraceae bacterium]